MKWICLSIIMKASKIKREIERGADLSQKDQTRKIKWEIIDLINTGLLIIKIKKNLDINNWQNLGKEWLAKLFNIDLYCFQ
jgi:hypothetical protein